MLRISEAKRLSYTDGTSKFKTSRALLEQVQRSTTPEQRACGVLLVGGADHHSMTVRTAQAVLRLDKQPSFWSHAALILDWSSTPETAIGVEVTTTPQEPELMVPERNGVTLFELGRYMDSKRYPNIAFVTLERAEREGEPSLTSQVMETALHPNRNRQRFPFWDWLGPWSQYLHSAGETPSPIVEGLPWPGAALVESAFESAGLDITPGATAPNACPETLWSTFLYWHKGLEQASVSVSVWSRCGDEACAGRRSLSPVLDADLKKLRNGRSSSKKKPRKQKRKSK